MAARPTTRLVLLSALALIFVTYFIFLQPRGPESPATRAPGHLTDTKNTIPSELALDEDVLKGGVVMPKLANETAKAELGRATWKFFHTMMARYPKEPTMEEQEALRSFVFLFSRLYPCGECASHFQGHLKKYPPQVSSRDAAAGWACFIHNEVNRMLKKPQYDCNKLDEYDCGCGEADDNGEKDLARTVKNDAKESDQDHAVSPAVEITKEPLTRGG
ncbi:FAD dependent sulfhydryl oxidase Erv2, putative [Talaromyces stipitatus ATCC 10500]|uniref:Sulfhydryl oxidase n=1 Tax=Talaromyces stipitatus (strain ATCC 10500 / CBS 375.48 / QM 6759 / NRRL 1006) TaxID=441959 RepID=B8MBA8_TALSN|nr:FAD dependent sulfhydryl oxidase Erv2, putative [Talaromyces stipitatus ATCC 10500]EED18897.1 FAD dependent sulfhydryl oxidase Erv2, putative [Talaromyces stipitatus ATCC 10500]